MRLISFILSAYFLVLITVPCCEFDHCNDTTATSEQRNSHPGEKEKDCSNCSPFFNCPGCAGSAFSVEYFEVALIAPFTISTYPSYILPFATEMNYDFWQPPQLG